MEHCNSLLSFILIYLNISLILGEPFYYTPYIEKCEYEKAKDASRMQTTWSCAENDVHVGYFTVDKNLNMNLYTLFVKSKTNWTTAPIIVWLQGQPGCTSLYAVFGQNGPCRIDDNFRMIKNQYAWTNEYNVLYIDNLVFTGYSYASKPSSYAVNLRFMSQYLYEALYQFYQMHFDLIPNDLYIAGEMYSGKYALGLGNTIYEKNPISHMKMSLKGLYIGSGFTDPENMMEYSYLLYQIGLIDYGELNDLKILEQTIRLQLRSSRFYSARELFASIWLKLELKGYKFPMDFTQPGVNFDQKVFDFLTSENFRKPCGLENMRFYTWTDGFNITTSDNNIRILQEVDALKSHKYILETLLRNYKVLYYAGQLDLLVPYVLINNFISQLEWKGSEEYYNKAKVPRKLWYVDGELAGFQKIVSNMILVLVRNSAQMIDMSQPKWAFNLLQSFINDSIRNEYTEIVTQPFGEESKSKKIF